MAIAQVTCSMVDSVAYILIIYKTYLLISHDLQQQRVVNPLPNPSSLSPFSPRCRTIDFPQIKTQGLSPEKIGTVEGYSKTRNVAVAGVIDRGSQDH